jgi:ABC-type sugar transport system permease subunit/ABC-type glycerol-3-phosphate transport system substrate-binding protein
MQAQPLDRIFTTMRALLRPIAFLCLAFLAAPARADIELRMTVWDGDESLAVLKQCTAEFENAHPGVHVKLESVFYNEYFTKLLAQYAAQVAPDVAMLGPESFQKYAERGALLPLEPLYQYAPGFDIKQYYEPIVKAHSWNGHLYVLPRDIAPFGLFYYNKKAFDEAGIPYPDGSWTWDFKVRPELKDKDFLWVLQQLTKRDSRGKPTRYGVTTWDPHGLLDMFLYSEGGRYTDDDKHPTKVFFDSEQNLKAHQLLADIYNNYHFAPSPSEMSSVTTSTADQLFTSQKSAMYVCGIWDSVKIRRVLKPGTKEFFDWDIAMAPAFAHGTRAYGTGGSGYAVMSSTPHPKESFMLAAWMAGKSGMLAMAKAGIAQPAIKKYALSDVWIPNASTPIEERYPPSRIITDREVPYAVFLPSASYFPELYDFLKAKEDSIWSGLITPKEGLAEAQGLATNRLKDILKKEQLPLMNWTAASFVVIGLILAVLGWVYFPERTKKLTSRQKRESRIGYWFISPWILGTLLFALGPMLVSLVMSMTDWDIILPARNRGVGNYAEAFGSDPRFWKSLTVTGIYTLFSVPLGIVVSLALALLLNVKVRGIAFFRTCFYLPALASTVAVSLIFQKMFQQDGGLVNSIIYGPDGRGNLLGIGTALGKVSGQPNDMANWLGNEHLALPSLMLMSIVSVGGSMIILLAGLQGIPQHYYEAATLDGANSWHRFKTVTLPLLSPSLFFVLITGGISALQVFTQMYVITMGQGSPNDSTRAFMLHLYDNAFKNLRMGYASALGWILFIVILLFTLLQFQLNRKVYYEADVR